MQVVASETVLVDGHYEIAWLWRVDPGRSSDNNSAAYKRWQSQDRRFQVGVNLFERYKERIYQQLDTMYCQLKPQAERSETHSKKYQPHHPVITS